MSRFLRLIFAVAGMFFAVSLQAQQPTPEQSIMISKMEAMLKQLHPVAGDIEIAEADGTLHLGKDYYFLPAAEAKRVVVEGWGNPPEVASQILGMVFPVGRTFLDDTWGAVITYEPTGYVSDEDSQTADYAALLTQMQEGEAGLNEKRVQDGYPAQHLVGWAQTPVYDARTHSIVWAQNIQFQGQADNSLNYDVRLLGRRGVLSLNMVTTMSKLDETRRAAAKFAGSAEFKNGARYADYQPDTDAKAEYGVAGLVAAGVGVAAAKKLGFLAIILAFGKKFIILIVGGVALLGTRFRSLFGRKGKETDNPAPDPTTAFEDAADIEIPLPPGDVR